MIQAFPTRPMSAFFAFSHEKRAEEKQKNPKFTNAQISRHLAQLWREASDEEKKAFIDEEYSLRQKYLADIAAWRQESEKEIQEHRKCREDIAMKKVVECENGLVNDSWENCTRDPAHSGRYNLSGRSDRSWPQYDPAVAWSQYPYYESHHKCHYGQHSGKYSGVENSPYPNHFYQPWTSSWRDDRPPEFSGHESYSLYHPNFAAHSRDDAYVAGISSFQTREQRSHHVYSTVGQNQGN
jgi:HMG (high mobility group) box